MYCPFYVYDIQIFLMITQVLMYCITYNSNFSFLTVFTHTNSASANTANFNIDNMTKFSYLSLLRTTYLPPC